MGKSYIVKWTNTKGDYSEKYYKDEVASKRAYARKKNEKTLKTVFCERAYYYVGDEFDGDDVDYTIDKFVRKTVMGFPLPQLEELWENGTRVI